MRNLNKVNIEPKSFLDGIIESKSKRIRERLERIEDDLHARYDDYTDKAARGNLNELMVEWDYDSKDTGSEGVMLYRLYDNSKDKIEKWRSIVDDENEDNLLNCPICEIDDPTEKDHYIPRELMPEFSVHPYNLIPICHRCNNKKRSLWCDSKNRRLIFNAYYDKVAEDELFVARIVVVMDTPKIKLAIKKIGEPIKDTTRRAITTIMALQLLPELNKKINEMLKNEVAGIKAQYKVWMKRIGSQEEAISAIMEYYAIMIEELDADVNGLKRILYHAIVNNTAFKQWINKNL